MKIGFIMPSEAQRKTLDRCRESVLEMRPDQIKHLEYLLRSWNIFGRTDAVGGTWRAIQRVLRDRP